MVPPEILFVPIVPGIVVATPPQISQFLYLNRHPNTWPALMLALTTHGEIAAEAVYSLEWDAEAFQPDLRPVPFATTDQAGHVQVCVYVYMCMYIFMYVCVCVYVCMCVHIHICVYIHMCV